MPTLVIKRELEGDYLSRTAADVIALNPGEYDTEEEVPVHLYKSLKEIFLGTTEANWADYICPEPGHGDTLPIGVHLEYQEQESVDDRLQDSSNNDTPGAKYGILKVLLKIDHPFSESGDDDENNPEAGNDQLIEAANLRIQYLLDYELRARYRCPRQVQYAMLDPKGIDNSIVPVRVVNDQITGGIVCSVIKDVRPAHGLERFVIFRLEYARRFGR